MKKLFTHKGVMYVALLNAVISVVTKDYWSVIPWAIVAHQAWTLSELNEK